MADQSASYNPRVEAFAGIDVAFAKRKRLPVCLCVWNDQRLIPLPLVAGDVPEPPRGHGNVASIDPSTVTSFADETAVYLRLLEKHFGVSIRRIAIDAPSDPRPDCLRRRLAETAMDKQHISCFATPSVSEFEVIRVKVRDYLTAGGWASRLPHANQLWMLVGFALFRRLRVEWECWKRIHRQPCESWVQVLFIKASQVESSLSWRWSLDIPVGLSRPFRGFSKR